MIEPIVSIYIRHPQFFRCASHPTVEFECGSSVRDGFLDAGRTLAKREVQMGSTSTLLALIRDCSLSAYDGGIQSQHFEVAGSFAGTGKMGGIGPFCIR